MPTLEQETAQRLATIAELYDISDTHLTGRGISEYEGGPIVGRFGGFKKSFHELRHVDDSPKAIAAAIRKGSGKVFDRVYTAVKADVEAEGFKPARRRSPGRPTEPPHEGRPYCVHCREFHTKGQHRSHGAGSFHRTHLFSFGGNPMKLATARKVFAELMKRSRARKLTDKEREALRRASQTIRYATRKTAANPKLGKRNPKNGAELFRVYLRERGFMVDSRTSKEAVAQLYKVHRKDFEKWRAGRSLFDSPGALFTKSNPRYYIIYRDYDQGQRLTRRQFYGRDRRWSSDWLRARKFKQLVDARDTAPPGSEIAGYTTGHKNPMSKPEARRVYAETKKRVGGKEARSMYRTARRRGYIKKNPKAAGGLVRMGKLVEIRYERDHGRAPGLYKHPFTHRRPTIYYRKSDDTIIIR